jgi:hypothetical protein
MSFDPIVDDTVLVLSLLTTQIIGLEQAQSSHNRPHTGLDAGAIFQSCMMDAVDDTKPSPPTNNPRH